MSYPLHNALEAAGVQALFCGPLVTPMHEYPEAVVCASGENAVNQALGSTIAGCRAIACLAGIDLASSLGSLAATAYTGCHRGLVILSFDGLRSSSAGTEFDSRPAARLVELPVVEPRNAAEAGTLLLQCYAWSEGIGIPIIMRLRNSHLQACNEASLWPLPRRAIHFLRKHNRWVTASHIAYARRRASHDRLRHWTRDIETSPFDAETLGQQTGILGVGACCEMAGETVKLAGDAIDLMTLSTVWPLPTARVTKWLAGHNQVLVIENGQPFVEEQIKAIAHDAKLEVRICGQTSRHLREEGSPLLSQVLAALTELHPELTLPTTTENDDPYGEPDHFEDSPFYPALKTLEQVISERIGRENVIIAAEPGPWAGLNEVPFELVDVRCTRGASMALADGLRHNSHYHLVCLTDRTAFLKAGLEQFSLRHQQTTPVTTILLWQDDIGDTLNLELLLDALGQAWCTWYTGDSEDDLAAQFERAIKEERNYTLLIRNRR